MESLENLRKYVGSCNRCTKFEDAVVAEYAAKLQLKEG